MEGRESDELLLRLAGYHLESVTETEWSRARVISDYVGQLPLGLELAGAYIKQIGRHGLKMYADLVEMQDESALNEPLKRDPADRYLSDYQMGVFHTWRRSFRMLSERNPDAGKFLQLAAFFHRSHLNAQLFREATRTKYHWTHVGRLESLTPRAAGVPNWLVQACTLSGDWQEARFFGIITDLEDFNFLKRKTLAEDSKKIGLEEANESGSGTSPESDPDGSGNEADATCELWIHPLVHQWSKESLEPSLKAAVAMDAVWTFLHSLDDCAQQADRDLLGFRSLLVNRSLRALAHHDPKSTGLWEAGLSDVIGNLKDLAAGPKAMRDIFRPGQFQTGGGGMINKFPHLMFLLQDFRTFLDRAYCVEMDPEGIYYELPRSDFQDTYAILIASQECKLRSGNIQNASGIFSEVQKILCWKSEYATALILSAVLINDQLHWERLLKTAPLVDHLFQSLISPRQDHEFSILTMAACAQLSISYAYAVGRYHHNNTNPMADPMNLLDGDRHKAVKMISSVAETALRSLEMLKAYQDTFESSLRISELTVSKNVQWQLQMSYAFACLREGRPDQAYPVFLAGISNVEILKGPEAAMVLTSQVDEAVKVQLAIAAERLAFERNYREAAGSETSHDDRDNFLSFIDWATERDPTIVQRLSEDAKLKSPSDYRTLNPRIALGRRRALNKGKGKATAGKNSNILDNEHDDEPQPGQATQPASLEMRPKFDLRWSGTSSKERTIQSSKELKHLYDSLQPNLPSFAVARLVGREIESIDSDNANSPVSTSSSPLADKKSMESSRAAFITTLYPPQRPSDSPESQLFVKALTGQTLTFAFNPNDKVYDLKSKIRDRQGIPQDEQRLLFEGKQLEDARYLTDYNM